MIPPRGERSPNKGVKLTVIRRPLTHPEVSTETVREGQPQAGHQLVVVGSLNPTKLAATQTAFETVWPQTRWQVEGIEVSDVRKQRLTGGETQNGARLRAELAANDSRKPTYGVGIESGMFRVNEVWMECSWVLIYDQRWNMGIGTAPGPKIPDDYALRMQMGETLDQICDQDFDRADIGSHEGYIGLVTHNAVTRTQCYIAGVACALAKFVQPKLFREYKTGP